MKNIGVWTLAMALILSYSLFALAFAGWMVLDRSSGLYFGLYMAAGLGMTLALGLLFLVLEGRGLLAGVPGFSPLAGREGCCR